MKILIVIFQTDTFSLANTFSFTSVMRLNMVFYQVCKSVDGVTVYCCLAHFQAVGLFTGT